MIKIRFAKIDDIPKIMKFIDQYWKKAHILATDIKLFQWQHVVNEEVHYVVAEEENTGELFGTMGYITMNSSNHPDISSMMVRARKCEIDFLGCDMSTFLDENSNANLHYSPGVNPRTAGLMVEFQGISHVGKMKHYYRLNDLCEYRIAEIKEKNILPVRWDKQTNIVRLECFEQFSSIIKDQILRTKTPYKDLTYIKHRYFDHPYYQYQALSVEKNGKSGGAIIVREVTHEDCRALRIVDFFGSDESISQIGYGIDNIMQAQGYEYIDFYCYGIQEELLEKAGFSERNEDDRNIIPNYFEPFERKNGDIYFHSPKLENLHAYKGDGDQDRPSIIYINDKE